MRINIRMTQEQGERFARFLEEHEIKEADAGRIAIERLLASKPKKSEREAAERKPGNPNFRPKDKS